MTAGLVAVLVTREVVTIDLIKGCSYYKSTHNIPPLVNLLINNLLDASITNIGYFIITISYDRST